MPRHVTSRHVMPRHVASCCYVMSPKFTSCYVMSRNSTSCHTTSCHVLPRHDTSLMSRHATSRNVTSGHVTSCYVISRQKSRDGHTTNASLSTNFFHMQLIQIKHDRVRWLSRRLPIPYRISGIWSSYFILFFFIHRSFSETTRPILTKFSGIVYFGVVWIIREF